MPLKRAGPFFQLIQHHIRASEYSFNGGDYQNAISHIQSLAELLNVTLPRVPYHDGRFTATPYGDTSKNERNWIIQNRPMIAKSVRDWMNSHQSATISIDDDEGEVAPEAE